VRSIREIALKIKPHGQTVAETILGEWGLFIVVILAVIGAFGLGRLSVLTAPERPVLVQNTALAGSQDENQGIPPLGAYLAAKNGRFYYFPWCTDALKIAPEQRRWFADEVAARKAGYEPATNCRGMSSE
jgi:hypothetical protein